MTYVLVIFSVQYVDSELTSPVKNVRAAITPIIVPVVGVYVKSEPMETAARRSWAAPYSEEAIPAI